MPLRVHRGVRRLSSPVQLTLY